MFAPRTRSAGPSSHISAARTEVPANPTALPSHYWPPGPACRMGSLVTDQGIDYCLGPMRRKFNFVSSESRWGPHRARIAESEVRQSGYEVSVDYQILDIHRTFKASPRRTPKYDRQELTQRPIVIIRSSSQCDLRHLSHSSLKDR